MALGREEARVERAVGGKPCARAVPAEGLRVTEAITPISPPPSRVAPAAGDLAAIARLERLERELGLDGGEDLRGGDDVVEAPAVRVADVHVLDEAQGVAAAVEEARHRQDAVLVDAALDDHVHLDRRRPAAAAASMPARTRATGKSTSFRTRKTSSSSASRLTVILRRAGGARAPALLREERAVRRQVRSSPGCRRASRRASRRRAAGAARRRSGRTFSTP